MAPFGVWQVIEGAKKIWEERREWKAVSGRATMVGGDFFKPGENQPSLSNAAQMIQGIQTATCSMGREDPFLPTECH